MLRKILTFPKRHLLLALGICCFFLSLIIRIDATLVTYIWDLGDKPLATIDLIASAFGGIGGLLVAGFYLWGYFVPNNSESERPDQ